jgi:hypothetical protein
MKLNLNTHNLGLKIFNLYTFCINYFRVKLNSDHFFFYQEFWQKRCTKSHTFIHMRSFYTTNRDHLFLQIRLKYLNLYCIFRKPNHHTSSYQSSKTIQIKSRHHISSKKKRQGPLTNNTN